jgi:hypothetical protein
MNARLTQALIVAAVAGAAGVAVWRKSDQMLGIVIATAVVGFILGLLFKFRVM